jgi:hypothetical protein
VSAPISASHLPARSALPIFAAALGALVMACSGGDHAPAGASGAASAGTSGTSGSTAAGTGSGASSAAAGTGATGAASGAPSAASVAGSGRKAPRNFEALKAELARKCPIEEKETNVDQKEAVHKATECLKKRMIADLDAILVPLEKTDKAKFDALMKEQAEWNRAVQAACDVEEERFWLDLSTGHRYDGTYRGYTWLGCFDKAYTERILYARALGAGKPAPLVKRIVALQTDGAAVETALSDLAKRAAVFEKSPPPPDPSDAGEDWKKLIDEIGKVQSAAGSLAKSTCAAWPEIAKGLGPKTPCEPALKAYYFAQMNEPTVGN